MNEGRLRRAVRRSRRGVQARDIALLMKFSCSASSRVARCTAKLGRSGTKARSDLLLSIVKDASGRWTSAEVDNQRHLGYGTYRWVVARDLSALDAYQVLGMFTFGGCGPSTTEIDLEPSHWGNTSSPNGSVVDYISAMPVTSSPATRTNSPLEPFLRLRRWGLYSSLL
jgi:hypothetical protein